jgi:AbrB family looped-hinge helix DNA binding protein
MARVRVNEKYQVTLPAELREKAHLEVGDILEAKAERGKITLTPKSVVDRDIEMALEEIKAGKVSRSFTSAHAFIRALRRDARKLKKTS